MIKTKKFKMLTRFPNKVDPSQRVKIECDNCKKEYDSVLSNRDKNFKTYNSDLCRSCKQKIQYEKGLRTLQQEICKDRALNMSGKTAEEIYGEEKGKAFRLKMSEITSGKNNPNYGGLYHGERIIKKGITYDKAYGEEKSNDIKLKLRNNNLGDKNPMYGKPSPEGSGNGWSGWYCDIFFRSLLELSFLKQLIDNEIYFENGEKSKYKIKYFYNGNRNYFCDFILEDTYIEIKPKNLLQAEQNRYKFKEAKKQLGENFVIYTEEDFPQLNTKEIIEMKNSGYLKFIDRYEEKFNEKYK